MNCEKYGEKNLKRSIYSSQKIKKGSKFNKHNVICLRPFNNKGEKIENFYSVLKKRAKKDIGINKLIKRTDLKWKKTVICAKRIHFTK